jgi:ATP-binding cassette, subfamily B, bacterial
VKANLKPLRLGWRTLRQEFAVAKRETIFQFGLKMLDAVFTPLLTYLSARSITQIVSYLSGRTDNPSQIYTTVAIMVIITASSAVSNSLVEHYNRLRYIKVASYLYLSHAEFLSSLSLEQHENKDFQKIVSRLEQEGLGWKPIEHGAGMINLIVSAASALVMGYTLFAVNPYLGLMIILSAVPIILVQKKDTNETWGIWHATGDTSTKMWGIKSMLHDRTALLEIIPQNSRSLLLVRSKEILTILTDKRIVQRKKIIGSYLMGHLFEQSITAGIEIWLLVSVVSKKLILEQYLFAVNTVIKFQSRVKSAFSAYGEIIGLHSFMSDYYELIDMKSSITSPVNAVKIPQAKSPSIEFKNVSFAYPSSPDKFILKDFSVKISWQDHIAIVGVNGAGKSTILKLLLRFYDPTEGKILVNGIDIKEVKLEEYYSLFGALFQDYNRYPLSFKDNILISGGDKKFNKDLYKSAVEKSSLAAVYTKLEINDEVDHPISGFEHSKELSGGEWQRLAIARAFYRDAPILILDEPTSAIDASSEADIFESIRNTQKDKTTIVVSHRFSTVRSANRIIVIDKGNVVEDGSHEALMAINKGLYRKMFEKQAKGYRYRAYCRSKIVRMSSAWDQTRGVTPTGEPVSGWTCSERAPEGRDFERVQSMRIRPSAV